ncbi:hypothetical protein [Sphingomonas sp. CFBP 8760]|uniref:hypothetical protein n=1 Tax=Sphingomonas sp. CFBP 8760 TaxID=2775282 RepID=UPI001784D7D7|nr:hypothetical protein [Sphingomonas sp. CFBP 8760]MBD8546925.1 hypothetical protein [Sphingomonas sp. CFBP 8760]
MRVLKIAGWALSPFMAFLSQDVIAAQSAYTWGKPGVSRTDYDADAIACSLPTALRDVKRDREAKVYVQGFEALERENNMPPMARPADEEGIAAQANRNVLLKRIYDPRRQVNSLQNKLQKEVETCLIGRGYSIFPLSKDQSRNLKKFVPGSEERRDFLYRLSTNAGTVASSSLNKNSH